MSDGEKMVWAAAFALELSRRLHAASPWPALTPDDAKLSALVAWRTVSALRFGVELPDNPEADEMAKRMVRL